MSRWQPDARGRLLQAAVDLFTEQGYDATTVAQIAERAGLTKATLFRLFKDKREILFQGQPGLVELATAGVEAAPDDAPAVAMLQSGLAALSRVHVHEQQQTARRINALIAASPDLQERAASKRAAIGGALEAALVARLHDRRAAGVLADMGVRAYYGGFDLWVETGRDVPLSEVVFEELASLAAASSRAVIEVAEPRAVV